MATITESDSAAAEGRPTASPIATAAEALAENIPLRQLPRPPGFMLRRPLDSFLVRIPDRNQLPEIVLDLVAPHWNQAVSLLGDDGSGYPTLVLLRDQLVARVETADAACAPYETTLVLADRIASALELEVERFGLDGEVSTSLEEAGCKAAKSRWTWDVEEGRVYVLDIEPQYADDLWDQWGDSMRVMRQAYKHETWADVVNRVSAMVADDERQLGPLARTRATFRFRRDVVDQVLAEFEGLGHAAPLEPSSVGPATHRSVAAVDLAHYSAEQLLFVVLVHEEVLGTGKSTRRNTILSGKKGVVGGVDGRVYELRQEHPSDLEGLAWSGDPKGGRGKARRLAEKPPTQVYWDRDDRPDHAPKDVDIRSRSFFDAEIRRLYEEICDAGVKSVDDVFAIAKARGRWTR